MRLKFLPTRILRKREQSHATGVHMDREHIKGAVDKAKGTIKDAAGKVTGDKELQTEGKLDKAKGSAHNAAGDVKDALRNALKDE
jgi:uncharacterized protein YjbJ (UPF0337 family)